IVRALRAGRPGRSGSDCRGGLLNLRCGCHRGDGVWCLVLAERDHSDQGHAGGRGEHAASPNRLGPTPWCRSLRFVEAQGRQFDHFRSSGNCCGSQTLNLGRGRRMLFEQAHTRALHPTILRVNLPPVRALSDFLLQRTSLLICKFLINVQIEQLDKSFIVHLKSSPNRPRSASRARAIRLLTVPTEIPSTVAISSYDRFFTFRRIRISRCFGLSFPIPTAIRSTSSCVTVASSGVSTSAANTSDSTVEPSSPTG